MIRKPSTGEPYAGKPPVRFGGRGGPKAFPTPIRGRSTRPLDCFVARAPRNDGWVAADPIASVVIGRLLRAFTPAREEIAQHRDFLVRAVEVAGDAGIEIGGARKYFPFSAIRSSKPGNFPHLGYPAVCFREHVRAPRARLASKVAWLAESSLYSASETPARCAARIIEQLMAVIPLVIPA